MGWFQETRQQMAAFKQFKIKGGDQQVKQQSEDLRRQIVHIAQPQQIILFGSYAYGSPTADADVELLVVLPFEGHPADQATRIRRQLETSLSLDLLVRTPEYVAERMALGDFFMLEVRQQGKLIYEAGHAGMDQQSRGRLGQRAA